MMKDDRLLVCYMTLPRIELDRQNTFIISISLIAITISSVFVSLMGSIVSTPVEVQSGGGLFRILSAAGFVSLAVLHWNLPSIVDRVSINPTFKPSETTIIMYTVTALSLGYFMTVLFPFANLPGYEYQISTRQFLMPFIFATITATSLLVNDSEIMRSNEQSALQQSPLTSMFVAAIEQAEQNKSDCTFCGEDIDPQDAFYERVNPGGDVDDGEHLQRFCSGLCVAGYEQKE